MMTGSMTAASKAKVTLYVESEGFDVNAGPIRNAWCERSVSFLLRTPFHV